MTEQSALLLRKQLAGNRTPRPNEADARGARTGGGLGCVYATYEWARGNNRAARRVHL